MVHLELRIDRHRRASWALVDPQSNADRPVESDTTSTAVEMTSIGPWTHLVGDEFCCYIKDLDGDEPTLLYARTGIFTRLGIPGGRYEPIGCSRG